MENKSHALMAGLFTITLLAAAVLLALWFNQDRVDRVPYEMATRLSIPGLNPQAAVRYRGLDVGKVDDIRFNPKVPGEILVQISVNPDTPIMQSTYGTLGYQGVTGIAFVQLDDDGSKPVRLPSDKKHLARIEIRPSLLDKIQTRSAAILEHMEQVTERFDTLLAPANQKSMIDAFDNVSKTAHEFESIPRQLNPTLASLPAMTEQMQQTLASVATVSQQAAVFADNLNLLTGKLQAPDGALTKITSSAEQLSTLADSVEQDALPRVNLLTNEARSSVRALNRSLDKFNEQPQSILFGTPDPSPGPGEAGFIAPAQ